ncbi:hypothetical protein RG963_03390 [Methanosarcina sp. Z-7115]|uniref:DUF3829 domain-containing protein n=1 Tax=Methanosarcina baikalica TaxID=3073890 RepID=A0ABU2CYN6_9EURY|nr:hypothetical protein [Methanosarcina sp. Z-7115]MDR7664844.1 hypothetical protein [Methanosarcina sp. Z-7115]
MNKNHLIISLIFIVTTIACGCAGGGYQDRQWEYSMARHTSSLSSDFKTVSDASKSDDFKTLVTYGQYIADDTQKAIDENNQFKVSPKLQEAQKEWGLAMQDYNSAGKLMVKAGNEELANIDAVADINQYKEYLKTGYNHYNRANTLCLDIHG